MKNYDSFGQKNASPNRRLRLDEAIRLVPLYSAVAFVLRLGSNLVFRGSPDWSDCLMIAAVFGIGMPLAHVIFKMTRKYR
ncbi:hypothetical protein [Aurantiacibacter poecillastricola]|uniref:hypothetical protein n=1 Tax=Aurantiacibacter poecillastricola TaxID=3064385 RepID=UPI00273F1ED1|nr:hypothetical protein [Aurantiacibacter sp. 219JJ12-13]MDP5261736.1 hypothetical protein [Aurantiacibacter sp. 219JJ12-13]